MRCAPLSLNHVGITVPDIHAAIDWYSEVFGLTHLMGPRLMSVTGKGTGETRAIFGPDFQRLLQAHLLSGNGIGFELFEPLDPRPEPPDERMHYCRRGIWHVAITHPDVDALVERIVANGGHLHGRPINFNPGRPWRLAYTRDPWWMTIEIVSHSYAEMFSNWPQPGAITQPEIIDRTEAERLRRRAAPGT